MKFILFGNYKKMLITVLYKGNAKKNLLKPFSKAEMVILHFILNKNYENYQA